MFTGVPTTPVNGPVIVPSQPLKSVSLSGKNVTVIVTAIFSALSLLAASVNAVVLGADTFSFFYAGVSVAFGITFFLARRIESLVVSQTENSTQQETIRRLEKELIEKNTKIDKLQAQVSRFESENQQRKALSQSLVSEAIEDFTKKANK